MEIGRIAESFGALFGFVRDLFRLAVAPIPCGAPASAWDHDRDHEEVMRIWTRHVERTMSKRRAA
jgi:hypothetical protein